MWTDSVNNVAVRGRTRKVYAQGNSKKAIIDSREKISLDKTSLQSQAAKSCDSILNPANRARNYAD